MTQALNLALLGNSVNASGDLSLTTGVDGTLPVANGGTGRNTLTANNVLLGNGTTAVQQIAPGASGNVLQSNGTTWASVAAGGYIGGQAQVFTTSGTFTVPAGITAVKVTVVGGGGGGGGSATVAGNYGGGGGGGVAVEYITGLSPLGTVAVTVGTGGASAAAGLTSSFGAFCSATGGAGGSTTLVGSVSAGGDGGVGSGGTYNLAGGVGANGFMDQGNAGYGGPGGGAGAEMTAKNWFGAFYDLVGCNIFQFVTNPNGAQGYINGKGGNSTGRAIVNTTGNAASGFGNGGGGAVRINASALGGAGTAGVVIVEY